MNQKTEPLLSNALNKLHTAIHQKKPHDELAEIMSIVIEAAVRENEKTLHFLEYVYRNNQNFVN